MMTPTVDGPPPAHHAGTHDALHDHEDPHDGPAS